jgi:hypothetical protein
LAEALDMPLEILNPILIELSPLKLFVRQGDLIEVDKEMRKYLESEIVKFDPDYEMGMEYLQCLLAKVPIHAIPNWYALSRTADHLFLSIVEKHLLTPQIYQRYLNELVIDYPYAMDIGRQAMKAPGFKLKAKDVMEKYKISHEAFEECMLHLEYNLVCCLGYQQNGDEYEEIVTPFFEWRDYMSFLNSTAPTSIAASDEILKDYADDFGFLKSIAQSLTVKTEASTNERERMCQLHLINDDNTPTQRVEQWLQLPLQEQAATLYRMVLQTQSEDETHSEKDVRQAKKSLKRAIRSGWIYFEDFIRGFVKPLGNAEPVSLKNRGKRWRYVRPVLSAKEEKFVYEAIFGVFQEVGIVSTGKHAGKPCFCVTPFGRLSLED